MSDRHTREADMKTNIVRLLAENAELKRARDEAREQRDRLAEALQKLNEYDLGDIPVGVVRRCEEALQSLNQAAVKGGNHES